jgi:anti-sigma B factor antagonist
METAIGVFDSREAAEAAVKELIQNHVPQESIIFLTRSETDAMSFGKDLGRFAGGFMGGAVGATVGCVGATLALIPGFGQVFALGVGGAALLGYLGSRAGGSIAGIATEPEVPAPTPGEKAPEEAAHFLEVLRSGRSLVLVQTEFHEVAGKAAAVLDRLGLGKQAPSASKSQASVREVHGVQVVGLRGRIAFHDGNTQLRETISSLVHAGGAPKILLNMQEVDFIDSSGIGELVRSHMAIRKQGGQLKLTNLSKTVNDLLIATSLNKIFDIHRDEASAVQSFGASGQSASAN